MSLSYLRKVLSAVLCAAMIFTMLPVSAMADELPLVDSLSEETWSTVPVEEVVVENIAEEVIVEEETPAEEVLSEDIPDTEDHAVEEPATEPDDADSNEPEEEPVDVDSESVSADEVIAEAGQEELSAEAEDVYAAEDAETSADETRSVMYSMTYYNPIYADIEMEEDAVLDGSGIEYIDVYCTNRNEAAALVREQMTSRTSSFVFGYKTTDDPTFDYLSDILQEIADLAMAHTGVPTEGDYLLWQYRKYNAYADGYYKDGVYYLNFHYFFYYYTTEEQEITLDNAIDSLLENLDVSGLNDYAKIEAIYDYICANVAYDYTSTSNTKYTAYAALVKGKAVCQGYASLLYRLALELGVDCRIIAGTANGQEHRWNIALLNGKYFNLDSTWDAGADSYNCFLVSDGNLDDHTRASDYSSEEFCSAYPVSLDNYSLDTATPTNWENISWENNNGELIVSGTGTIPDCTSASEAPWAGETFSTVTVTGSLTGIGTNAFEGSDITAVTVDSNILSIGQSAFAGCAGLTSIYIMNDSCKIYDAADTLGSADTTVVYGYYSSTARDYANKYGYEFVNMGFSNRTVTLDVTTVCSAGEPVVRLYDASATDLVVYEDIVKEESEIEEHSVVSVSDESLNADSLYTREVMLQDVEPGRYKLAVCIPGSYVIRVEYVTVNEDISLGDRHMWLYGDVDDNGLLDSRDATQIYRLCSDTDSIFGSTSVTDTERMRLKAADANMDGLFTSEDAQYILDTLCDIARQ